jgi:hypothetical protein
MRSGVAEGLKAAVAAASCIVARLETDVVIGRD